MSGAPPRRIAVVGTSGAGKTTFARQVAARLDVTFVELDALFWLPGWIEPADADFRARVESALAADAWVVDGNYSRVRDLVLARADTIAWLDIGLITCTRRVTVRAARRAWRHEVLWGTNRESLRKLLGRDSLAWWVITTHGSRRRETAAQFADPAYGHLRLLRFRSNADAEAWLASV
jgi:adenylate kinase family enzyme